MRIMMICYTKEEYTPFYSGARTEWAVFVKRPMQWNHRMMQQNIDGDIDVE